MNIAGLAKTTLVDFPGVVAATVFTRGCTFKCHFCHNPELVIPEKFNPLIPEDEFFTFLESRLGKLGGVCITGGEPTINSDLPEFISHIKALGFKVKLDTNGTNAAMLKKIIDDGDTDYIAMDIKAPLGKYAEITNTKVCHSALDAESMDPRVKPEDDNLNDLRTTDYGLLSNVQKSIKLIMNPRIPYEFRTTVAKPLHEIGDMEGIGKLIEGANRYFIQNYVKSKQISSEMLLSSFSDKELLEMKKIVAKHVKMVEIR